MCGNCYASQESWEHALGRYRAAITCAQSAAPRPGPAQNAASTSWAESLANAYNNLGNVLRLQHEDRVDEAADAYLGAAEWMPQLDDACCVPLVLARPPDVHLRALGRAKIVDLITKVDLVIVVRSRVTWRRWRHRPACRLRCAQRPRQAP